MTGQRFNLVLVAMPSNVPALARLKGLLKAARRSWGLRCIEATEQPDEPQPATTATTSTEVER